MTAGGDMAGRLPREREEEIQGVLRQCKPSRLVDTGYGFMHDGRFLKQVRHRQVTNEIRNHGAVA